MDVNGTLLWYFNICKREVWLMNKNIVPNQNDENIALGKFLHEKTYKRKDKEIVFGNVKFDVVLESKDRLVIGETKKSSKFEEASKWQLMYYLWTLKKAGINASGVLLYPNEKKRVEIELDKQNEKTLIKYVEEIENICQLEVPPKVCECKYCKNCGYREYCYA